MLYINLLLVMEREVHDIKSQLVIQVAPGLQELN